MTVLQNYLTNPKVQKVLKKRPGEKGFSLIELVVVVAVLAILAAIAIPSFTSLNAEAKVAGAKTTLANLAKECAVKLVDSDPNNQSYTNATYAPSGFALSHSTGTLGTCGASDVYVLTADDNSLPTFSYNAATGAKTCANGTLAGGANVGLGCTNNTW